MYFQLRARARRVCVRVQKIGVKSFLLKGEAPPQSSGILQLGRPGCYSSPLTYFWIASFFGGQRFRGGGGYSLIFVLLTSVAPFF